MLLSVVLQEIAAPARNAIMARLALHSGPLPDSFAPEGRWLGWEDKESDDPAEAQAPTVPEREEYAPNSRERADALWRLLSGLVEVASRPCTAAGYPPLPHQEAQP